MRVVLTSVLAVATMLVGVGVWDNAPASACRMAPGYQVPADNAILLSDCSWSIPTENGWETVFLGPDGKTYESAEDYMYSPKADVSEQSTPDLLPAGGGSPLQDEAEHESKDLPWYLFLAGAFIVPLGVLYVWTFVRSPKGGGGH